MNLNDKKIIFEMGIISNEVYDNDPSGTKYFKENPQNIIINMAEFDKAQYLVLDYISTSTGNPPGK